MGGAKPGSNEMTRWCWGRVCLDLVQRSRRSAEEKGSLNPLRTPAPGYLAQTATELSRAFI